MSDELRNAAHGLLDQYPWLAYWWVLILAGWGGVVNYIRKIREGEVSRFSLTELVGELVTSGFAGLLTFLMCRAAGLDDLVTGVLVGISGHMGARGIYAIEQYAERIARRRLGIDDRNRKDDR